MKNESNYTRKFSSLLKQVRTKHKADPPPELDPVTQLVIGFLEWNATRSLALKTHEQLMSQLVDNNDLRVSLPHELVNLIEADYPDIDIRISRMREVLQEIYVREHNVTLDHLQGKNKKQVRTYLDTLPGIVPYVVDQLMLLNFGFHAVPIDDVMLDLLKKDGVIDPEADIDSVSKYLDRVVKSGDGVALHASMRAWADLRFRAAAAASHRKKTTKKTTKKRPPRIRKKK